MKALSIKQPWAWLIVNGFKDIENRNWRADNPGLKYRGKVLIHTGLNFDMDFCPEGLPEAVKNLPPYSELPMGGIVGTADIVDCVKEHPSPWFFGRYGFVLKNARPVEFIRCVGQLGFFEPNYDLKYVEKPPKKERVIKRIPEPAETLSLFGDKK